MMDPEKDKPEIWAVVLAAGESKRMGSPKMLLPFRGKTIIEHVIEVIREAGIGNIMTVIGAEVEKLSELLQNLSVYFCINNNYREGMLSSVRCGINSLPSGIDAIMVFPGDQPLIAASTIKKMTESYNNFKSGILFPVFKGRRGHPLLFDAKYRDEIHTLDPGEGLRSLITSHPEDVHEIDTNDPGILKDIDTYEDYLREINLTS